MTLSEESLRFCQGVIGDRQLLDIANRLTEARDKHPVFAEGQYHALGVIADEMREFEFAVERESPQRQRDEVLDVIVTCIRFLCGEHEVN